MMAYVSDSYYTAIQCSGNYTTTGNTLYPEFWVKEDLDQNHVADDWELPLAEKFCPNVCMHKNNPMIPSPVEILLDNTSLCYWVDRGEEVFNIQYDKDRDGIPTEEAFELYKNVWNGDWWLDFGGTNNHRSTYWWGFYYNLIKSNYSRPTVYTHCFAFLSGAVIQYWFFYPYNDWAGDHEGDWEHINVKVSSQDPAQAEPLEVVYYFHKRRQTRCWTNTLHHGNHPVVYVGGDPIVLNADGEESGASYPCPGLWLNVVEYKGIGVVDESINPGRTIYYTEFNITNMTNNYNLWWMKFPGHWGVPKEFIFLADWRKDDAPKSPIHHECWEVYQHEAYEEY